MKTKLIYILTVFSFILTCCNSRSIYIEKLTGINPVSYTDVVYAGLRDTVFISTYSGRIARRINGINNEVLVAEIADEIYALAYNFKRKQLAAATLQSGIILLDENTGDIIQTLRLKSTWAVSVFLSANLDYLYTNDLAGNQYIWEVNDNYKPVNLPDDLPKGKIISIDRQNTVTIAGPDKIFCWNLNQNRLEKIISIDLARFADMDKQGNFLSIDFNTCSRFNSDSSGAIFTVKHPNWPLPNLENEKEVFDIPYSMQLTGAKFAGNKVFTSSIDRTIRVWDKDTGVKLDSLIGHKATVDKMAVSADEKQLVSVDLKGGIRFWEIH